MTSALDTNHSSNKRVAKNSLYLLGRMLLIMVITFYTSRVVLDALGIDDFGIYNLIGGVIVMFSFLSNALLNSCQRYLSVAVGSGEQERMQATFSTSLGLHVLMALIVGVLTEILGLWLLYTRLNIPPSRMDAAFWVFQVMTLATMFQIMRIPFTAIVVSHEKMGFFAVTSLVEAALKLLVVYLLWISPWDKLVFYSWLILGVNVLMLMWFMAIVRFRFDAYRLNLRIHRGLSTEMVSFTGWNLLGGIADVGYKQGTSIILNIFFGVAFNATMGIVNQVRNAVFSFSTNVQMAAGPQIIKRFSAGDDSGFESLVCSVAKFSVFLMMCVGLPIIANIDFVLDLWLDEVPPHCASFCVMIVVFCIVDSQNGPLWTAMEATGRIKTTLVVTSILLLLNLPFTYLAFSAGMAPDSMLAIQIAVTVAVICARLICLRPISVISFVPYCRNVVLPLLPVGLVGVAALWLSVTLMPSGWGRLWLSLPMIMVPLSGAMFLFGCTGGERRVFLNKLKQIHGRF